MKKVLLFLLCAGAVCAQDKPLGKSPSSDLVNPRVPMGFKSTGNERKAHGNLGATQEFDVRDGNYHTGTLTANCTITTTHWQTSGTMSWMQILWVQNGTGKFTVTGPAALVNTLAVAPYANAVTKWILWTSDGGTTVYGYSDAGGGINVVSKSAAYTTTASDANGAILHPTTDNNARTFTIDSNTNVPYPVGTTITFVNQINTVTIAITSDTLTLQGANTTGSRTLAAGNTCTAVKIGATSWIITGSSGLTWLVPDLWFV